MPRTAFHQTLLRSLLPSTTPRPAPLPFFFPSLSPALLPSLPARFFTPARSIHTTGLFTPSFSTSTARSALPSSPFLALRASFRTASFSPSRRPTSLPGWNGVQARAFSTGRVSRAIKPYLARGRGRGGYGGGSGGGGGPWQQWKDSINRVDSMYILGGLIALNVGVFGLWFYASQLHQRFRDASLLRTMTRNFTVSWQNITQGRVWTLITSAFSHEGTGHIIVNMASLWFLGGSAAAILGNTGFLSLYLFSGLIASATSALFARFVSHNPYYASHGASGSTFGVASFFACAFPKEKFLLFFVLPVPAWLCVGGLFAWDMYSGLMRPGGTTDSMGHVGGMIAGGLFFLRKIRRI